MAQDDQLPPSGVSGAAWTPQTSAQAWQPIETAPKVRGIPVLFVSPAFKEYSVGVWDGDCWDMQCAPPLAPFTHWMPLPEPPQ